MDEVLDRALDVFWSKGFEGTSIQDLVEATGLVRASLYGAFGDKEKLYERVIEHYIAKADAPVEGLDPSSPTRVQLDRLFGAWVGPRCAKVGERGCFLSLAGTQADDAPFARAALAASTKKREKLLAEILQRGQARGDVVADRDAATLGRMLVVLLQGIATAARAGTKPERLRSVLDEAVALVTIDERA